MEPKVSIIIPVYNVEPFLARCLDSVVGQTLRDIEIICVDDGSPDRSIDILNRYAAEDARIRVISQENRGLGGARNRGFDAATGEFVLYVDSDDWIDPAYCERLYEAARETGADVACASMLKIRPSYSKWTIRYTERQVVADVQEKFRVCRCPPDFYVMNKLLRREMLLRLGLRFRERVCYEDVEYTMRVLCEGGDAVTVPDVVYRYNGTHSNKRITLACTKDYLRGLIAELKLSKKKDLPEIHTLCCDRLMREADFYAQRFLKTEDPELLALLLEANAAVSPQLLKDLPENGSVILPALRTIWHAGCRYLRWRDQRIIRTLCDVFVK